VTVWRFSEGDEVPPEVIPIDGGSGKWMCDVVVYDGGDGFRHIIAQREPYLFLSPSEPGGAIHVGGGRKLYFHVQKFFHAVN
jgi:hypothetical protein